ncbi:hypothetical protein ACFPZ0_11890 [Streptomonospora nanhaiensis]|uniref:Uncharacterized protein n=1 Tax=Streptomonospora nanhaiensis TaxID=1323731 RepID=A0A853BIQ6_9ACTN|nr:hypothetical protein [Streptomonospora nanhaiensis]MBV2362953.1 hypothetical protein [Streptomonospora nanhaiensis]MBX9388958.1 hypothetical protein [Streptomonospora nanhaiensis]NYI95319.1 hypothetical protein [Streptomonospora nanhaiensis]
MTPLPSREYTPRPLDRDTYERFVAVTLAHRGWCARYSADESGDVYYQAVHHGSGDTVGSYDLDRFALLLAAADAAAAR